MSTNAKREVFTNLARIGTALSSATRIEFLELLAQAERSVEQLATLTGVSAANTSQHLQKLRQAGLITGRKEGLYVFYRLAGDEIVGLLSALGRVGETYLAEIERIVRLYLSHKDDLEAVPAKVLLERARKGLVTVLDVRPPEEFAAGHVPGAINIPIDELEKRLSELPKRREVVAYCRGPYCLMSYDAVALLRTKGRKARRLEAGLPEWRAAGLPVVSYALSFAHEPSYPRNHLHHCRGRISTGSVNLLRAAARGGFDRPWRASTVTHLSRNTPPGAGVSPSDRRSTMAHEHFKSCIDACNDCALACDHCAAACLKERDVASMTRCIQLDMDCAQACRLAVAYMARGSEFAANVCDFCATVCEACAQECARHPMAHCQDCAKACRRCAEECRRMASDQMRKQSGQRPAAAAH